MGGEGENGKKSKHFAFFSKLNLDFFSRGKMYLQMECLFNSTQNKCFQFVHFGYGLTHFCFGLTKSTFFRFFYIWSPNWNLLFTRLYLLFLLSVLLFGDSKSSSAAIMGFFLPGDPYRVTALFISSGILSQGDRMRSDRVRFYADLGTLQYQNWLGV